MINLYSFSATGRTQKISEYFSKSLGIDIIDIDQRKIYENLCSNIAVVVFPVYCQNIPFPVKVALSNIKAENFVIIATYGKKSFGNVIYDATKLVCGNLIAAAYVPIGHTYLSEDVDFDCSLLEPILNRISNPKTIKTPKFFKNPLADFIPEVRSRIGVKIKKTNACNGCNVCAEKCVMKAILKGEINGNCIRCLRCVDACPNKALTVKYNPFLTLYLKNTYKEKFKYFI